LISLSLTAPVTLIYFLSYNCILAALLINGRLLCPSDALSIFNKGLGLSGLGSWTANWRKCLEWRSESATSAKASKSSTKKVLLHGAKAAAKSASSKPTTSEEIVLEWIIAEECISSTRSLFLASTFAILFIHLRMPHASTKSAESPLLLVVEEHLEGVSAAKEFSEYLVGVTESESTAESLSSTAELRAASATAIEHLLAALVVYSALLLIWDDLVGLANPFEYLLSLLLHRLVLVFVLYNRFEFIWWLTGCHLIASLR
jgi:hypothetical protein